MHRNINGDRGDKVEEVVLKEIYLGKRSLDTMHEADLLKKLKHPHVVRQPPCPPARVA